VHQNIKAFVGKNGSLEFGEEAFDKVCNQVWVGDSFEARKVASHQFFQGLVFFVDRHAFPEKAFFLDFLWVFVKVGKKFFKNVGQFDFIGFLNKRKFTYSSIYKA
jgi:hypothetical protein